MKVVVAQSFQVADAGVVYRPGHVADVPDDVAQHRIQSVWRSSHWPASTSQSGLPLKSWRLPL